MPSSSSSSCDENQQQQKQQQQQQQQPMHETTSITSVLPNHIIDINNSTHSPNHSNSSGSTIRSSRTRGGSLSEQVLSIVEHHLAK